MSDVQVGVVPDADAERDAIHCAIMPMIAGQILQPGEHVGIIEDWDNDSGERRVGRVPEKIGIVDPFLTEPVLPGSRFWLFLYPRTVVGMRHHWVHPAFDQVPAAKPDPSEAEVWLRRYADYSTPLSFDELIEGADEFVATGEYLIRGGELEGYWVDDEFWRWYEKYRGVRVPEEKKRSFFSCAC